MIEICKNNKVIGRSKNLRGILERCRKVAVKEASQINYAVTVVWVDNAHAHVNFQDQTLAKKFIERFSKGTS